MGNKPGVAESPSADRRPPPRTKRSTLNSRKNTEISNPVPKPPHKPYVNSNYIEDDDPNTRMLLHQFSYIHACIHLWVSSLSW